MIPKTPFFIPMLFLILLTACASAPTHRALQEAGFTADNLIPSRKFVANVNYQGDYQLSPNGLKLAYIAYRRLKSRLYIENIASGKTTEVKSAAGQFWWGPDSSSILFYKAYSNKPKNYYRLMSLNVLDAGSNPVQVAPELNPQGNLALSRILSNNDNAVIATTYDEGSKTAIYYKIDLATHEFVALNEPQKHVSNWVNRNGEIAARKVQDTVKKTISVELSVNGEFVQAMLCKDIDMVSFISVEENATNLLSNCQTDKVVHQRIHHNDLSIEIVDENKYVDISEVISDPNTGKGLYSMSYFKGVTFNIYDDRYQYLKDQFESDHSIVRRTSTDKSLTQFVMKKNNLSGTHYFLVDVLKKTSTLLLKEARPTSVETTGSYQHVQIPTRNNQPVYGFLARPNIKKLVKGPTIIYVHGGPQSRAYPSSNPQIRFLSNRGYSVLSLNYSGSTGYGKKYLQRPYGNPRIILEDIADSISWLVDNEVADPENISITGGSYGGYLSLLAAHYNDDIKCAAAMNPMVDLQRKAANIQQEFGSEAYEKSFMQLYFGSLEDIESGNFDDQSPMMLDGFKDNRILLAHGKKDTNVSFSHSKDFYEKMNATNNITLVPLVKAGHGINRWSSNLKLYSSIENFYKKCLGGAAQGYDYFNLFKIIDF